MDSNANEDIDNHPDIQVALECDTAALKRGKERSELGASLGSPSPPGLFAEEHTFTTYMSGRFSHVEFGTYFRLPACLIVMKFKFHAFRPSSGTRFKSGKIEVIFNASQTENEKDLHDAGTIQVLTYAPELVYGEVSSEHRKWYWDIAVPVGYTDGALNAGIEPSLGFEREYTQGNRAVVMGSETGESSNGIIWSLEESKTSEQGMRGIPAIFTVACIVQHNNQPFQATFKVNGRVGFSLDPMHWLPFTGKTKYSLASGMDRVAPGFGKLADPSTGSFDDINLTDLTTFTIG